MKKIGVALLGLGVVGGGTYKILTSQRDYIRRNDGIDIEIKCILEKNIERCKELGVDLSIVSTDIERVVNDPEISVVAEFFGGIEPAKTFLIKALEENGIGRPSTYAPIITTIIDRGYVERDQKKLKPTLLGRAVDGLMLEQFPHIVDVDFSAQMEKNLDKVESGKADWRKTVDDFYQGFEASLEQAEKNMEGKKVKVPDEPSSEVCDLCGRPMVIKVGKYGKFLACSGFPECRGTKRLVKDTGGICPKCGKGRMLERKSAKGRIYYGCERYPDCDFMTWDMPVATKCEKCGSTLFRKGSKLYCAKEGCGFEMPVPKKD